MFYIITSAGVQGPTFVKDDDDMPAGFTTENEAHEHADGQPLCDAFGYAILRIGGEVEITDVIDWATQE